MRARERYVDVARAHKQLKIPQTATREEKRLLGLIDLVLEESKKWDIGNIGGISMGALDRLANRRVVWNNMVNTNPTWLVSRYPDFRKVRKLALIPVAAPVPDQLTSPSELLFFSGKCWFGFNPPNFPLGQQETWLVLHTSWVCSLAVQCHLLHIQR